MISSFEDLADYTEDLETGDRFDQLCNFMNNPIQFGISIYYLRSGYYFWQATRVMMSTKERTCLASIGSCSDYKLGMYAQFSFSINLQNLVDLLESAWTFTIYMDMSTHRITSYL